MGEFFSAALPWLIIGLALAVEAANAAMADKRSSEEDANYLTEGMCLGMAVGLLAWLVFKSSYAPGLAMLVGEAVGACINKKD